MGGRLWAAVSELALYKGLVWLLPGVQGGGVAETVGVGAADVSVAADEMAEIVDVVVALDVGPPRQGGLEPGRGPE